MSGELRKLDEPALDDFSKQFAEILFKEYPDWKSLAEMDLNPTGGNYSLVVRIEAPVSSHAAHPLSIYTENEEVTVAFDHYHAHFDWPNSEEENGPMKFIADLLEERVAVASAWSGEKWAGSWMLAGGAHIEEAKGVSASADRAIVRSWRGSFDADYKLAANRSVE